MLLAEFVEGFFNGPRASCPEIRVSLPDALDRFLMIFSLPFQIVRERLIKGCGGILSVPLGVVVQLGLTLRREMYFHAPKVRVLQFCVNPGAGLPDWINLADRSYE